MLDNRKLAFGLVLAVSLVGGIEVSVAEDVVAEPPNMRCAVRYFKVDTHKPAGSGLFVLSRHDAEQSARDHNSSGGTYAVVRCKTLK